MDRQLSKTRVRSGKILVVEDEGIVGLELRQRLEALGHLVVGVAGRGEEAVELAERHLPELVLMDIKLPGLLDGAQTAAIIRERFGIPSVFLSAYSDDATIERIQGVEPFGYILKPYDERLLHVTIQSALYRALAERERESAADEKRRAEKAEAVARLAAGVVHDVNNLLSAIRCNAYVIESSPDATRAIQEAAGDIATAVERGATLMTDLVKLARDRRQTPLHIEIDKLVESTARLPDPKPPLAAQPAQVNRVNVHVAGAATVLVVDDDPVVRRAITKFLKAWGLNVLDAKDPASALALIKTQPIDVLITDLLMPDMNGYQLASRALKVQPGARVVYMSGYAPESLQEAPERAAADLGMYLQKPFAVEELKRVVAEALPTTAIHPALPRLDRVHGDESP